MSGHECNDDMTTTPENPGGSVNTPDEAGRNQVFKDAVRLRTYPPVAITTALPHYPIPTLKLACPPDDTEVQRDSRRLRSSLNADGGFNCLPNELMLSIFNYLNTRELLLCASVCERWRFVSSDWHVWQQRLQRALHLFWNSIEYPGSAVANAAGKTVGNRNQQTPDLATAHPRDIYVHLVRFVPGVQRRCEYAQNAGELTCRWSAYSDLEHISETKSDMDSISVNPPIDANIDNLVESVRNGSASSGGFRTFIYNWWHVLVRSLPQHLNVSLSAALFNNPLSSCGRGSAGCGSGMGSCGGAGGNGGVDQQVIPRFAVFGPGFDRRITSRLFHQMVGTRTPSFQPINMFPGYLGFGSGLTMKMYANAQIDAERAELDIGLALPLNLQASSEPGKRVDDYIFDMIHLYSLSGHLNHTFEDQFSRICMSRLFDQTSPKPLMTEEAVLANLKVTETMQCMCAKLNGLMYALDAREPADQLRFLRFELNAVLAGFPDSVARQVPILILYIMPKEEIAMCPAAAKPAAHSVDNTATGQGPPLHKDSFKGATCTASWHGSLLSPLTELQLFQLPNPWRLQKVASNDIVSLIQGILWLKSKIK